MVRELFHPVDFVLGNISTAHETRSFLSEGLLAGEKLDTVWVLTPLVLGEIGATILGD